MADQFALNTTPATWAIAMFNWKTQAKLAGWTVLRSGDGTTFFSGSDGIVSGLAGAGGLDNANAYFDIKWPGSGSKSISIQRCASNLLWRIKYSFTAGFTTGSASATRVGTATDEKVCIGTGTDASPTGAAFCNNVAAGGLRHHVWFQTAAPYAFFSLGVVNGGAAAGACHFLGLDHMLSTSYQAGDVDPWILLCSGGLSATGSDMSGGANAFTSVNGALAGSSGVKSVIPNSIAPISNLGIAPNPYTGKDEGMPLIWMSTVTPTLFKGWSDVFYYQLTGTASASRTTPTAQNYAGTRDKCLFGNILVPWDGSVPTV